MDEYRRERFRQASRAGEGPENPPTGRPLNEQQRTIWSATQSELAGDHNLHFTGRITGHVEGETLELALERLVGRHEDLRTTFHAGTSGPVQRVRAGVPFQLEFVDARRWRESEMEEIIRLTSRQPIDLATCPLRAVLFSRSDHDHVLLVVTHCIAVRHERMRVLLAELMSLYGGGIRLDAAVDRDVVAVGGSAAGVLDLFGRCLKHDPDAAALRQAELTLSYRDVDRLSNQMARQLRQLGIERRGCVAIDLPASVDAVIAHLAVLKLGAVAFPHRCTPDDEEQTILLEEACPTALLTDSAPPAALSVPSHMILHAGSVRSAAEAASAEPVGIALAPESAAMLVRGSSEGADRLVALGHGATLNLLYALGRRLRVGPEDRVLASGDLGPRQLLLNVLLPLSWGATVFLEPSSSGAEPLWLSEKLQEHRITLMEAHPATWQSLLAAGWEGGRALRGMCDARPLEADLVSRLVPRVDELWSLYGHPEATICSAASRLLAGDSGARVGEALAGTRLHLLDELLRAVADGEPGELYLGGPMIARGYHREPTSGGERFIPDPFSAEGRGILFRTGERYIRGPDGCLTRVEQGAGSGPTGAAPAQDADP